MGDGTILTMSRRRLTKSSGGICLSVLDYSLGVWWFGLKSIERMVSWLWVSKLSWSFDMNVRRYMTSLGSLHQGDAKS